MVVEKGCCVGGEGEGEGDGDGDGEGDDWFCIVSLFFYFFLISGLGFGEFGVRS